MSVGVDALDNQHRELIRVVQSLHRTKETGGGLGPAVADLDRYVREHFSREERLMREAGFEDFAAHCDKHRDFEAWLANVKAIRRNSTFASYAIAEMAIEFLRQWLVNHIMKSDQEYALSVGRHLHAAHPNKRR